MNKEQIAEFRAMHDHAVENEKTWPVDLNDFKLLLNHISIFDRVRLMFSNANDIQGGGNTFANADFEADFTDSNFAHCNFDRANMCHSTYTNVKFRSASFTDTDLEGVDFINCDLSDCWFGGANLRGVNGLRTISSVGQHGRQIYAYVFNGETRIQAGCRNATPEGMRSAIDYDYAGSVYKQDYLAAVKLLESWGKLEVRRLKALAKGKRWE